MYGCFRGVYMCVRIGISLTIHPKYIHTHLQRCLPRLPPICRRGRGRRRVAQRLGAGGGGHGHHCRSYRVRVKSAHLVNGCFQPWTDRRSGERGELNRTNPLLHTHSHTLHIATTTAWPIAAPSSTAPSPWRPPPSAPPPPPWVWPWSTRACRYIYT